MRRWRRRALIGTPAACVLACCALALCVLLQPLPAALAVGPLPPSVRVLDRHGRPIAEVRRSDGSFASSVAVSELPDHVTEALVAAEDGRFYAHPGVDPLALARAGAQLVWRRRVVSGASTITQQLARTVVPRPRTVLGKLREMIVALRIEAELDKSRILEEYLNRVAFGPNLRGIDAASRFYFDKPAQALSLSEAAVLVAIPRGPTFYDPARGLDRVRARRDVILERLRRRGHDPNAVRAALAEPLRLQPRLIDRGAFHLVRRLVAAHPGEHEVVATLDMGLQREIEALARKTALRMRQNDGSAAAVLVVDNRSGDVLAHVGSPDFFSVPALGQNDGTEALRQPGSALKPFIYAAALEDLGLTTATLLPDVELHLPAERGSFSPQNYDGKYHGPVRLREALGNSLNVPAVYVADRLGVARALEALRRFGFESLTRDAAHYGAAIALGDGEVTLAELARAYVALARGGSLIPLRVAQADPRAEPRQVVSPRVAALIGDVLADPRARQASFGQGSVLELPFAAAVKTGTSKAYRDNWAIGYTREVTVAVWVGNFDGHPMRQSSGVTGAGPLFNEAMQAAMRSALALEEPAELVDHAGLVSAHVCTLSGERAGPDCPHRTHEWFVPGRAPSATCSMHLGACEGRPGAFERYPAEYTAWALGAGRPLCTGVERGASTPAIRFPYDGARFLLDDGLGMRRQEIVLAAQGDGATRLTFVLDGRPLARVGAPFSVPWRLAAGQHTLAVRSEAGLESDVVRFLVE